MSWQKCPKCNGFGKDMFTYTGLASYFICNGYGVINEQTGAPLYKTVTTTSANLEELKDKIDPAPTNGDA